MNGFGRGVIWFNRFVLGAVFNSPTAVTVVRVGFGGFPLGFAVALLGCLVATRRLLIGTALVLAVVGAATVARVQGLILDGATPYNLGLLRPEIAMVTLSAIGIMLERRRRRGERHHPAVQTFDASPAR